MTRTIFGLGGNALVSRGEATHEEQVETIRTTATRLAPHYPGRDVLLTHGNGPQVGHRLLETEATETPDLPLDVLVAETQAQIGYLLTRALDGHLDSSVLSVTTQVAVDPDDPAFGNPTKPIGPFYDADAAEEKPFETANVREREPAYRRVVPSPEPREIVEADAIETLLADGVDLVCGGGGGVPVVRTDAGLRGRAAVIDKDRTSRLLGQRLDADELVFLTDVAYAYRDFASDSPEPIETADPATLRKYLAAGEFGEGSMRPKVEACATFVESRGGRAVITCADDLDDALAGDAGTQVEPA